MLKWHVTPRSPYYEWVIHRHIGYTAPKHTKFHISNPLPPTTTTKKPKKNSRPQRQTTRGDSFFFSPIPPAKITSGTGSLPGLLLLDGDSEFLEADTTSPATRTLLLVRGLKSWLLGLGKTYGKNVEKYMI